MIRTLLGVLALGGLGVGSAFADVPQSFVYQGQILKSDLSPLEDSSVDFMIQIFSPGPESCLLYVEHHSLNMTASEGYFLLNVGAGSRIGTSVEDTTSLEIILDNSGSFPLTGLSCASGTTFTPDPGDSRFIRLHFDTGAGRIALNDDLVVRSVPYAMNASKLNGKGAEDFLQIGTADNITQDNLEDVFTGTGFGELLSLINGSSSLYAKASASGANTLPRFDSGTPITAPGEGDIWFDSDTNQIKYHDGTTTQTVSAATGAGTVTSITVGDGLVDGSETTGSNITSTGMIKLPDVGTAGTYLKVTTDAKGRIQSGSATLAEIDLPTIVTPGKVSGDAITSGTIGGSTAVNTSGAITTTGALNAGSVTSGTGAFTSFSTRSQTFYDSDNTNSITINPPATADLVTDYVLTLPIDDGGPGQFLSTDGSGVLFWDDPSGAGDFRSDGTVAMSAALSAGGNKIINLASPTLDTDAATKKYVDDEITAVTGGLTYTANDIANTPAGDISSTNVQTALNELDTKKQVASAELSGVSGLTTFGGVERTGAGTYSTYSITAAGKALLDDFDATAQRFTLGLGTIATQDEDSVSITGGTIDDVPIGATTPASGAFTTLSSSGSTGVGGALSVTGNASFLGNITLAPQKAVNLGAFDTAQESTLVGTLGPSDAGKFWYNSSTSSLNYWTGSAAQTLGVSGAGLQSLSGDTSNNQTLSIANGAAVTTPTWNHDGSGDHELQLPMASSAGVTAGLLSKTEYDALAAKLTSTLSAGEIFVGNASNMAMAVTPSGDLTLSQTGVFTLANSGVGAGTYRSVTVDAKGRVTAGTNPTTLTDYGITNAVENAGGVPSVEAGLDASMPAAGNAGSLYVATDTLKVYRDDGTAWEIIASTDASDLKSGTLDTARLDNSGIGAGTYRSVTVDAKGRATAGTNPTTLTEYGITDAVGNEGGAVSLQAGADSAKPAAGTAGQIYFSTDNQEIYYDNGSAWTLISSAGPGGAVTSVGATAPLSNTGSATAPVIALTGTVPLASGGTGATTAADARTNLELGTAATTDAGAGAGDVPVINTGLTGNALLMTNSIGSAIDSVSCATGEILEYTGTTWACISTPSVPSFTAADIANVAAGNISATDVQAALNELDSEKQVASAELSGVSGLTGTGVVERTGAGTYSTFSITAAGKDLLDDADATAQRSTLGLGTIATQDEDSVSITGGAIDGVTIGAATPASGAFTALSASGNTSVGGTLSIAGNASFLGNITLAPQKAVNLGAFDTAQESTLVGTLGPSDAGKFWYNSSTSSLNYWTGSAAQTLGVSGAGLQSLSGDTSNNHTLSIANGAAVTTPTWNHDGSGDHELQLPMASSAGVTAGLLSKTEYDALAAKLTSTLSAGQIFVGSAGNIATAVTPGGDVTMSQTGVFTLANSGVGAGTYKSVTVDAKGRVTAGTNPTTLTDYGITDAVENSGGVPSVEAGLDASVPAAGNAGALYVATDTLKVYRDNGTTWDIIASTDAADLTVGTLATARLDDSGVGAGTYKSVTVDAKGRVTAGTNPTTLTDYGITDAVGNAGGAVSLQAGTDVAKPAAGTAGRIYLSTDNQEIYYDNGSTWTLISSAGPGGAVTSVGATAPLSNTGSATAPVIALTGTIPLASGGTGATTAADARTNLELGTAASVDTGAGAGDIPVINTGLTGNTVLMTNSTGTAIDSVACSTGEILEYNGTTWACIATPTGGDFKSDGTIAMTGNLRLNGNWLSNDGDSEGIHIDNSGNVGIGSTAPSGKLDVEGGAFYLPAPNVAPLDANLSNNQFSIWLDETNNEFEMIAKKSNGTLFSRTLGSSGGTAAGSNNYIQYKAGSGFGAESNFQYNPTSNSLTILDDFYDSAVLSADRLTVGGGWENPVYANYTKDGITATGATLASPGGHDFSITAGAPYSSAANAPGGNLYLSSGVSRGGQSSLISFATAAASVSGQPNVPTAKMVIIGNGNVGIGTDTPNSALQVNGYIQLALTTGVPASGDCDHASEYGRIIADTSAGVNELYMCTADGWKAYVPKGSPGTSYSGGYFVQIHNDWSGYNGNLGGLSGANTLCLNTLSNEQWIGKDDAVLRGLLTAAKVQAFLCDNSSCQNLAANTDYKFARSDSNVGGFRFTTDSSGSGPGDGRWWDGSLRFSEATENWTGRNTGAATAWSLSPHSSHCSNWSSSSSGVTGRSGLPSSGDTGRWSNASRACNTTRNIICAVNP